MAIEAIDVPFSAASYWLDNCYELHLILQHWTKYQAVYYFSLEYIITHFSIADSILSQGNVIQELIAHTVDQLKI